MLMLIEGNTRAQKRATANKKGERSFLMSSFVNGKVNEKLLNFNQVKHSLYNDYFITPLQDAFTQTHYFAKNIVNIEEFKNSLHSFALFSAETSKAFPKSYSVLTKAR